MGTVSLNPVLQKSNRSTSSETQGRLVWARGNKSGKEIKRRRFTSKAEKAFSALLVNLRRFIFLPDLFPLAPTNRPWVSEDDRSNDRKLILTKKLVVIRNMHETS